MNKKFLILCGLITGFAFATVPASIDRSNITLGQSFNLTIDLSNVSGNPDLEALKNTFDVGGVRNFNSVNMTNSQLSSQKSLVVSLSPKNIGQQTIPAIKVGNDATAPISIDVLKPSNSEIAKQNSQIFVLTKVNSQTSYIGVPIILDIKFYYSVQVGNVSLSNIDIKGATIQQLDKGTQYTETRKGIEYNVLEQRLQVTPTTAGNITIPSIKINGITANDDMAGFGIPEPKQFNVSSPAINLTVKPIPNGVDKLLWFPAKKVNVSESSSIGDTQVKLGQPISRTIIVEALGVPYTSIPDFKLPAPIDVNSYPDKTITNNSFNAQDLVSTKIFKVVYIPTKAGTLEFPEMSIKWWDITSNSLKTIVIPGKTYTVLNENGSVVANASANTIQQPALSPIPTNTQTKNTVPNLYNKNIWFYLSIVFFVLWLVTLVASIILYRKKSINTSNKKMVANEQQISIKKAYALVNNACKNRDVQGLNSALVSWASQYFQKKIYTVLDIKDLSNNETLNSLLEKFNQTLYRGSKFVNFDDLNHEISILANEKQQNSNDSLKELYPK